MKYYNIKIYLNKSFPFIGNMIELNYDNYRLAEDFVSHVCQDGVAVQSLAFGTVAVSVHQVDYVHAISIDDGTLMPAPTAAYFTT